MAGAAQFLGKMIGGSPSVEFHLPTPQTSGVSIKTPIKANGNSPAGDYNDSDKKDIGITETNCIEYRRELSDGPEKGAVAFLNY